ncbi:MAG: DUF6252 family protein [Bacteroidales bacterium]
MDTIKLHFTFFVFILALTGCMKDYETVNSLSVKVDGELWTAKNVYCDYNQAAKWAMISAFKPTGITDKELLFISFKLNGPGIYPFTQDYMKAQCSFTAAPYGMFLSYETKNPEGQIVVTEFDTANQLISGTYTFVAYHDSTIRKVFTEGKFINLHYTKY